MLYDRYVGITDNERFRKFGYGMAPSDGIVLTASSQFVKICACLLRGIKLSTFTSFF
jgi:hypothetical protein